MSAQNGGAISLSYNTQPAQAQDGGAIVLEYAAPAAATRRMVVAGVRATWGSARAHARTWRVSMATTDTLDLPLRATWGTATPQGAAAHIPWGTATQVDASRLAPWGAYGHRRDEPLAASWLRARPADDIRVAPWGAYGHRRDEPLAASWLRARPADDIRVAPWGRFAVQGAAALAVVVPAARPVDVRHWVVWTRYARPLMPGWGIVTPPGGPDTDEFGTILIPVRRTYIVTTSIQLRRLPDLTPLHATALELAIDAGSWSWSFRATVPADHMPLVEPQGGAPVEVEAIINGITWTALVEHIGRDREFGRAGITLSGRSRAAALAAPYAPVSARSNAEARTARQLMEDALTTNGVPLGWELDWQITDWLVGAGAWSHLGTPLDGVLRVAESVGALVQADRTAQVLHILPRYPSLPWDWSAATPHMILPLSVLTREGVQWSDKPPYNAVYVAGESQGIIAQVKRAGTAGDVVAPLIVDPLITAADAARQRGGAVLADTGRQARISLSVPLMPDDGLDLLTPGQLLQIEDGADVWRGLVRGVTVTAGLPVVKQTIELERHYL